MFKVTMTSSRGIARKMW